MVRRAQPIEQVAIGNTPVSDSDGPVRSVRASDPLWNKAKNRAKQEHTTMSNVLLRFIRGYAEGMIDPPRETLVYRPATPGPQPED